MRRLLKPLWVEKYLKIYKSDGWKGLIRAGGIKLIIGFILFYLVRDSILYLLPIYLSIYGIQSCG